MESQRHFKHGFRALALATLAFTAMLHCNPASAQVIHPHDNLQTAQKPNFAYEWMDVLLETTARDMERTGARPTVGSRQMAIVATAMFDAWAAYDERAVGTVYGNALRRPAAERTEANRRAAISYAVYRTTADQFPVQIEYLNQRMRAFGYDPDDRSLDITTAVGIGNTVAAGLMATRHHDGANQLGDEPGSDGQPYSDYTYYSSANTADKIVDPDRWHPIPFSDGKGGTVSPGFLTPHWYRVKPFALQRSEATSFARSRRRRSARRRCSPKWKKWCGTTKPSTTRARRSSS